MDNNYVLKQIRYAFDFKDAEMVNIFSLADLKVSQDQVVNWMKKEDDKLYVEMKDVELATFLNGLINLKRGKRDGVQPIPENRLNNNIILRKLKIALNLKDHEVIQVFDLADMQVGKPELSSFFRNPTHKNYRICKDQFLRNFLYGIQLKYRSNKK